MNTEKQYFFRQSKESSTKTILEGIGILAIGALALYAIYVKGIKPYFIYERAPKIPHCVQKGDTIWDYFIAENTKGNLDWDTYKSHILRINNSDIDSFSNPKNQINLDSLIAGTTIQLLDINRDGKVGVKK
ncbi:MAG: hypothetical protein QW041_02190 [Candidatus Pacearchaeota archaeon]